MVGGEDLTEGSQESRSVGHVGQIRMRCTAWADRRVNQGSCGSEHRTARDSSTREMQEGRFLTLFINSNLQK